MPNKETGQKKKSITLTGVVVSNKAEKTVTVSVERIYKHPMYKKTVRMRKKFLAHDEGNLGKPGDVVRIRQVRPISKRKKWLLEEVISSSPVVKTDDAKSEVSK